MRNTLIATYKGKPFYSPTGSGAVQLKIDDPGTSMKGWCIWHDRDTQRIEASEVAYHQGNLVTVNPAA